MRPLAGPYRLQSPRLWGASLPLLPRASQHPRDADDVFRIIGAEAKIRIQLRNLRSRGGSI